ncbi:MAG TPA: hypothetical protein DC017_15745 [Candidatus Wallbacteria bacterium]|nr:hypothetical protein [Candidatus Wallbacteria bacterium]
MSSKSIICLLMVSVFLAASVSFAFAGEARCTIVKVSANGQRLSDVVSCDAFEMLVIQLFNNIQNPYDLKNGMKIMIPEKAFMVKVKGLSMADLKKEISEYRQRVPETMAKEVNESIYGAAAPAEEQTPKADKTVNGEGMNQLIEQEPQEFKKSFFPTRPTQ